MLKATARLAKQLHFQNLVKNSRAAGFYPSVFRDSLNSKEEFWAEKAELLTWHKKWDRVYDKDNLIRPKW